MENKIIYQNIVLILEEPIVTLIHSNTLKECDTRLMSKNYPTPGVTSYPNKASLLSLSRSCSTPVILRCKILFGKNSKSQKLTV